jgi:hypothetical protein
VARVGTVSLVVVECHAKDRRGGEKKFQKARGPFSLWPHEKLVIAEERRESKSGRRTIAGIGRLLLLNLVYTSVLALPSFPQSLRNRTLSSSILRRFSTVCLFFCTFCYVAKLSRAWEMEFAPVHLVRLRIKLAATLAGSISSTDVVESCFFVLHSAWCLFHFKALWRAFNRYANKARSGWNGCQWTDEHM